MKKLIGVLFVVGFFLLSCELPYPYPPSEPEIEIKYEEEEEKIKL